MTLKECIKQIKVTWHLLCVMMIEWVVVAQLCARHNFRFGRCSSLDIHSTWLSFFQSIFLSCTKMTDSRASFCSCPDVRSLDSLPYLQNQFKVDRVMMSLLNARHY